MTTPNTRSVRTVVLAYSGGLDTSIIIPWLRETYDCDVIAFAANIGQGSELDGLEAKAKKSGASKCIVRDLREEFLTDYCFPMLQAGAIYEEKYLLGTAIARPIIAAHMMDIVEKEGADAVAHGCTGKGNDQVRFELTCKAFDPTVRIIAPWREWTLRSREECLAYAEAKGIPVTSSREKLYSHDRNIWHLSSEGGVLEDPWNTPPDEIYHMTTDPRQAPDTAATIELGFTSGAPTHLNGEALTAVALLEHLNQLGGRHGIGRVDIVENRLVGMKSRGVYETPGGTILYEAHKTLERLVLDAMTLHFKESIAPRYAELVYNGLWFTPLREALDAFVAETQKNVTGTARVRLYKGRAIVEGRKSPYSLYREDFATFGEDMVYNQKDAEGFINLFGLPLKVRALIEMEGGERLQGYQAPKYSRLSKKGTFTRD
ncbi:MAG: argininosuccinate synthase [Deltaproteobacteria bacterium]|nr:argininosuccinate synthase [Deltaproteobacteria bacterium]